jgi:hypothetical protein
MEWYNGFSPQQRAANGRAMRRALDNGALKAPTGPCALCGDPNASLEYHSEDYSKPYRWDPPAAYALCRHCHRNKLHKRFARPEMWKAFKAHVRRGGYASDLRVPEIKREFDDCVRECRRGIEIELCPLRPYSHVIGSEWWEKLATDARETPPRALAIACR